MKYWFLLAFLFVLAGCGGGGPAGPQPVTGTDGVIVSPLDKSYEVYEKEQFSLVFEMENRGRQSVLREDPGKFYIAVDKLYFTPSGNLTQWEDSKFWLDGRTEYLEGERAYVTLFFEAHEIERYSPDVRSPVIFSACYPYSSTVTHEVCIEQARRVDSGAIVCTNDLVRPPTPGAPIVVKEILVRNFRQSGVGSDETIIVPSFRITLRNAGKGVPAISSCDDDASGDDLNTVGVHAFLLNTPLDCGVDATTRFVNKESVITCSLPADADLDILASNSNFVSFLTVQVDYTYRDSARTDVRIVR